MHDLKHFTKKRRIFSFESFFKGKKNSHNIYRMKENEKPRQKRFRILLPILAVLLALYPFSFVVSSLKPKIASYLNSYSTVARASTRDIDSPQSFHDVTPLLNSAQLQGDRLVVPLDSGGSIHFTIDPILQQRALDTMRTKNVPYGVFVAIEPKSGKILAMTGYSSVDPAWGQSPYFNLYPMASLFKIITAAAALEQKKIGPDTLFEYRGSSYSENPKYWNVNPGQSNQSMPLSLAMGKSINPVFGRLASDYVGAELIMTYAHRFGFNQVLFPGTSVIPSKAAVPQDDRQLKLMGAGLGREVKISPLHAAVIMAAIANHGTMMTPLLTDEVRDKENNVLYSLQSRSIRNLVTKETAEQLTHMLSTTVTKGTSRKAFHDRRGRPLLDSVTVAAKTGSINGTDPVGHYSWFAAYAPVENPQIALVALIINQDKWKIKASYLGEQALEQFFDDKEMKGQANGIKQIPVN
jgi:cell division protein FtsI/penicillin-binding protein 2